MAELERKCGKCGAYMAPNWSALYCPVCGGSIKTTIKPRSAGVAVVRKKTQRTEEAGSTVRRSRLSSRKRKERRRSATDRTSSILGPHFSHMSPTWFLIRNIATAGIKATLWLYRHIATLRTMSTPEERLHKRTLYLWLVPYLGALLCAALAFWRNFASDEGTVSTGSFLPTAAIGCMVVSILINRHILFWSRRVIIDHVSSNAPETIRFQTREFAPSSLLLWFFGAVYLQAQINRLLRKKSLRGNPQAKRPAISDGHRSSVF